MATTSSARGGDSSRRYCQPRSSARFESTWRKPESVSRIARRRFPESDISLLRSWGGVGGAGGRERSHSPPSLRDGSVRLPPIYSFFTGHQRGNNGLCALEWQGRSRWE